MRYTTILLALIYYLTPTSALAIIEDIYLSEDSITKSSSFKGAELTLTAHKSGINNDYIASITGPKKKYIMWEKDRKNGMWVNDLKLTVPNVISFFRIYSTEPFENITNYQTLKIFDLDLDYSDFKAKELYSEPTMNGFYQAFKSNQKTLGHYSNAVMPITKFQDKIQLSIKLPENIPLGEYTVKLAEFENGKVRQLEFANFTIQQTVFYQYIDELVKNSPITYSIIAIIIAVGFGLFAGLVVGRR